MNNNRIIAALLLVTAVSLGIWFYKTEFNIGKDVVYLVNGTIIEAERVWRSDKMVHYRQRGEVRLIHGEDVKSVVQNGKSETRRGWENFEYFPAIVRQQLEANTDLSRQRIDDIITWSRLIIKSMVFILAALALVGGMKRAFTGTKKPQHPAISPNEYPAMEPMENVSAESPATVPGPPLSPIDEIDGILLLFLNIFKIQCGAIREAPARYIPVKSDGAGPNRQYELQVLIKDEWKKRRMSIGPLGEESGSNSKCFDVIYDSHMVIKIPRTPVTKFSDYIKSILKQRDVVEALRPWECIAPRVSVILEKIYTHSEGTGDEPDPFEEKWVDRISQNTIFQNYLKIGEGFAYFMDLAEHHFLGQIIRHIHDLRPKIVREMSDHFELIWDHPGFVGRYGVDAEEVCTHIQRIYRDYDEKVRILLSRFEIADVHSFQIKKWFLTHLSGDIIEPEENGWDDEVVSRLNGFLAGIMVRNKADFDTFNGIIRQYVREESFAHNQRVIANLVEKMIRLIDGLADQEIALRDLKPDNLLVIGDPHGYPEFLRFSDQFNLGIIDVETAVSLDVVEDTDIPQPLMGGTPNYATPSHFMKNPLLLHLYNDLPLIFRLQDWFAAIGIIFKLATGRLLFRKTAPLFPSIIKLMKNRGAEPDQLNAAAVKISHIFWKTAKEEFRKETAGWEPYLNEISVTVSSQMADILRPHANSDLAEHERAIRQIVASQEVYQSDDKREYLLKAETKIVRRLLENWEQNMDVAMSKPQARHRALAFLNKFYQLKKDEMRLRNTLEALSRPDRKMTVFELLHAMFWMISRFMLREKWGGPSREEILAALDNKENTFYEATI